MADEAPQRLNAGREQRRLKIAVIADSGQVPRFALDALNRVDGTDQVTVFSCTNTRLRRRAVKHGAYYALNLVTVRNPLTRPVHVAEGRKRVTSVTSFESMYDGAWQQLPDEIIDALARFDIVLKFGMGLMRVPPAERLPVPILSYHHGDPDKYRGRPAGFWEIAEGEPVIGQMIQVIGNKLDAGNVVAYAETKVFPWSYRASLIESFRHSPLIINTAIRNALAGVCLDKPCKGRNWRLPSNLKLIATFAAMTARRVRRMGYGALVEKRWEVSTAACPAGPLALLEPGGFPNSAQWRTIPPAPGYLFYADPFFYGSNTILVEALRTRTGIGEIVWLGRDDDENAADLCVSEGRGHMSYPGTFGAGECEYIVPEMASWSRPIAYSLDGARLRESFPVDLEGGPRLLDPTFVFFDGRVWLFGNIREEGSSVLRLWSAPSAMQRFVEHRLSPVRISPEGSRMAGGLIEHDGRLIRLGQDFRSGYGDGICAFEVEQLTEQDYRERPIGRLRFADRHGPHTLNIRDGRMVFDWYRDRLAPMAGVRRFLAKIAARRARKSSQEKAGNADSHP